MPFALLAALSGASATPFTLAQGQTVRAGQARITLLRVQDTRCPPRAYCIMAGNVTASLMVSRGGTTRTLKLWLPGQAVNTPAGALKLTGATRPAPGQRQKLTFDLVRP